jgi:membrane-associated phospholipid phosphatase
MQSYPSVMTQDYQTVLTMTQNRTDAQALAAIHDDRTAQPYSVLNGLGALTSYYLTGAGVSASGTTPQSVTQTSYATATFADYKNNINFLNGASAGVTTFGNGSATPLAAAVAFINNTVRANASTEPVKRDFERYQGSSPAINPLDPRYANYNAITNKAGLTTPDTAGFVVLRYLSNSIFTRAAAYASDSDWVKGFTVTAAMIAANGGNPITVPDVGTFDAAGKFTPATINVGDYVPGIGTAPRPYRILGDQIVPSLLYPIINSTNPYADGAFVSGHTNSAYLQALGVAFLIPQQGQELLARAADLGNNRILAGMHSPLDVIGGRMEATAIAATNIYGALYDGSGNRLDWTNPANASAYAVYQAYTQTQSYLAQACNAISVMACIQAAQAAGYGATDPYGNAAQNKANYVADLTYGFQPFGPVAPMTAADVPVQAQVLLLTRFPYLSDAQRTEILATTGLLPAIRCSAATPGMVGGSSTSTRRTTATAPSTARSSSTWTPARAATMRPIPGTTTSPAAAA